MKTLCTSSPNWISLRCKLRAGLFPRQAARKYRHHQLPVFHRDYDKSAAKVYGIKMMRKPDSNMSKAEIQAVVELFNYLLDEAAR